MKKIVKWIGIVLGVLVVLMLVMVGIFFTQGDAQLNKTYAIPENNIPIPTDTPSIAKGKRWVTAMCTGCHGADLSGRTGWMNAGPIGTVDSANLTSGQGGVGQEYKSISDYVHAIRDGVDPDGKPTYMPSVVHFAHLSDADLGAMLAYLKTVPAVDNPTNGHNFGPLGKILIGSGAFGKFPAEEVDHDPHPTSPAADVNLNYGQYLVEVGNCRSCHGKQLAGGPFPDPSVKVRVPNLTPGGELFAWSGKNFITAIRTGKTPSGHALNDEYMPWKGIGKLTDNELNAMWIYLKSLPKLPTQTQ